MPGQVEHHYPANQTVGRWDHWTLRTVDERYERRRKLLNGHKQSTEKVVNTSSIRKHANHAEKLLLACRPAPPKEVFWFGFRWFNKREGADPLHLSCSQLLSLPRCSNFMVKREREREGGIGCRLCSSRVCGMGDSFLSWVARTLQRVPEVNKYKHDPEAFTQGLLWSNGSLFESTGLYGRSSLRELQLGSRGSFAACSSYSRFMVLLYYDGLLILFTVFICCWVQSQCNHVGYWTQCMEGDKGTGNMDWYGW